MRLGFGNRSQSIYGHTWSDNFPYLCNKGFLCWQYRNWSSSYWQYWKGYSIDYYTKLVRKETGFFYFSRNCLSNIKSLLITSSWEKYINAVPSLRNTGWKSLYLHLIYCFSRTIIIKLLNQHFVYFHFLVFSIYNKI